MAQYFTSDTDEAIKKFNESADDIERHAIFNESIKPAFEKLIESLIFVYGYFHVDDVDTMKMECLTFLYEMTHKYDASRGTKSFSYFNVIAKNWFICKIRELAKRRRFETELSVDINNSKAKHDPKMLVPSIDADIEERERWVGLGDAMELWKSQLKKKQEISVLEAIVFIMKNPDLVPIYNKKAVYLYLRELTGLSTKQVVMHLKKIKSLYCEWSIDFEGDVDDAA